MASNRPRGLEGGGLLDWLLAQAMPTEGGCLEWPRAVDRRGYGRATYQGKSRDIHRLVFELAEGPIPDGLVVRHTCDNTRCIHLKHLILGTHLDNATDKVLRGRSLRGIKQKASKLTEGQVREIRADPRLHRIIAKAYGVSRALVSHIKRRIVWTHI